VGERIRGAQGTLKREGRKLGSHSRKQISCQPIEAGRGAPRGETSVRNPKVGWFHHTRRPSMGKGRIYGHHRKDQTGGKEFGGEHTPTNRGGRTTVL